MKSNFEFQKSFDREFRGSKEYMGFDSVLKGHLRIVQLRLGRKLVE